MNASHVASTRSSGRRLWGWVPILVSLTLLGVALAQPSIFALFQNATLWPLAVAIVISIAVNLGVGTVMIREVCRTTGHRLGWGTATKVWAGTLPLATFVPFQLGHTALVLALRRALGVPLARAAFVVGYDKFYRLLGLIMWLGACQLALSFEPSTSDVFSRVLASLCLLAPAVALLERPLRHVAARLGAPIAADRTPPLAERAKLLVLGVASQCSAAMVFVLAWHAVDPAATWWGLAGYPIVQVLAMLPASVSGFGVRAHLVHIVVGCRTDTGVASGLLVSLIEYGIPAVLGLAALPYVIRLFAKRD